MQPLRKIKSNLRNELHNITLGSLAASSQQLAVTVQFLHAREISGSNTDDDDGHWLGGSSNDSSLHSSFTSKNNS